MLDIPTKQMPILFNSTSLSKVVTTFLPATDYMAQKIPVTKKVIVANAGHGVNIDQPQVFEYAVLDFLDSLKLESQYDGEEIVTLERSPLRHLQYRRSQQLKRHFFEVVSHD